MKKVSIIICTRDRADSLYETLKSIESTPIPDHLTVERILVDNGSDDHTREVVQCINGTAPVFLYHYEGTPGLSNARNKGIEVSMGDILLWTDDDVRVPDNWLEGMTDPILRGEADAVAGGVVIASHLRRPWMEKFHRTSRASTERLAPEAPEEMVGANMAFSREVLTKVPAFDPEVGAGGLGAGEDSLFSFQIIAAGYRLTSAFDTKVIHHFEPSRLTRRSYLKTAENLGRSNSYIDYHWKHKPHSHWTHPQAPTVHINLIKRTLRYLYSRVTRWSDWVRREGISEWEFFLRMDLYRVLQYRNERKRDRAYDQFGGIKKCCS